MIPLHRWSRFASSGKGEDSNVRFVYRRCAIERERFLSIPQSEKSRGSARMELRLPNLKIVATAGNLSSFSAAKTDYTARRIFYDDNSTMLQ